MTTIALTWATPVGAAVTELENGLTLRGDLVPLIEQLAPKIDIFAEIWAQDPDALIYGGGTRDLFYYVMSQFKTARNRREIDLVKETLLRRERIQVREFMMAESDIDVATRLRLNVKAEDFNIRKIDYIYAARLDISTPMGRTEVDQGYLPAEKITLGKNGFKHLPQFKDGLDELFSGTFTFELPPAEVYNQTYYVVRHLNHPILLVLRHLRMLAMDEYNRYGDGVPTRTIDDLVPADTQRIMRAIVEGCLDGRELEPYLANGNFAKWLNGTIAKAFRAHANATLANQLMQHFGIAKLAQHYSQIKFINNYLFAKSRNPAQIARHLDDFKVNSGRFFLPADKAFPGGGRKAYHGTGEEWVFNAIVTEGIIQSAGGSYGEGFYCVGEPNKEFASRWRGSGNNVVLATINENAKIVDISEGEGRRVFEEFRKSPVATELAGRRNKGDALFRHYSVYDDFADHFGVDAVHNGHEFAIKNSVIIENITGAYKRVLTFPKALEIAPTIADVGEFRTFIRDLGLSRLSHSEMKTIFERVPLDLYVDNVDRENLLYGLDAKSAITIFEMIRDKVNLPKLYRVARQSLKRKVYLEVIAGTIPLLISLPDDLLIEIVRDMRSPAEVTAVSSLLLRRLNHPVAFQMYGEFVNGDRRQRDAAFVALRTAHTENFSVPWTEDLVATSPLDELETWTRPEQYWVALSWLKSGFRQHQALRALEIAANRTTAELHLDILSLSYDGHKFFGSPWMDKGELLAVQQSMRDGASVLLRATESLPTFTRQLDLLQYLNFAPGDVAQLMGDLEPQHRFGHAAPAERRPIVTAFVRAATANGDAAEFKSHLQPVIDGLVSLNPEMLPELFTNPTFRLWMPLARLTATPVENVDYLVANFDRRGPLLHLLSAFQLAVNHHDPEQSLARTTLELTRARFKRDVFLVGQSELALSEVIWLLERLVTEIRAAPDVGAELVTGLVNLPALDPSLEMTEFGSKYEILRVRALLRTDVESLEHSLRALEPILLDPTKSRNFKLASARALRQLPLEHPLKLEIEKKLKWEFWQSRARWYWFAKPRAPQDFFREQQGIYAQMFRLWRSRDVDFVNYLIELSEGRGGGEMVPAHLADTLVDLELPDPRFLPFFTRHLGKTGAKNMPLFFRALIRLFPQRAKEIMAALYVVHNVPELLKPYVEALVLEAEREPRLLEALRQMRRDGVVPRKRHVTIEGLWLDDWLERELDDRRERCEAHLTEAS